MQGRLASSANTAPQELTNCRGAIWRPPHEAEIVDRNNLLLRKGCAEMRGEAPVASHGASSVRATAAGTPLETRERRRHAHTGILRQRGHSQHYHNVRNRTNHIAT